MKTLLSPWLANPEWKRITLNIGIRTQWISFQLGIKIPLQGKIFRQARSMQPEIPEKPCERNHFQNFVMDM
jgi:hypothetical protein